MTGDAGIDWRPIERADAAAWSATLTEIQHADRDWEFLTEQDLLDEFGDPDHDFPRGSVAAFAGGTMAAFARLIRNEAFADHWGSTETPAQAWAHYLEAATVSREGAREKDRHVAG